MSHAPRHEIACAQYAAAELVRRAHGNASASAQAPAAIVEELWRTHPPDMPFGLGTTAFRLAALLRAQGFAVKRIHGGLGAHRAADVLAEVAASAARGWPVPVCVDDGLLGGRAFEAHWALVTRVADGVVHLSHARVATLPVAEFLRVWACRALPWTHNACALLVSRPSGHSTLGGAPHGA